MSHVRSNWFKIVTIVLVVGKVVTFVFALGVTGQYLSYEDVFQSKNGRNAFYVSLQNVNISKQDVIVERYPNKHLEMVYMHFTYGLAECNSPKARRLYVGRYPNKRLEWQTCTLHMLLPNVILSKQSVFTWNNTLTDV